ncbi:hypothetical protein C0J52_27491 [Blattella germanica]|nr:hypothetical protein C0J52_27491 [Blattella germanica]
MHEARGKGYRANIINDKLKINGKNYDLDYLENEFRNAENLEQSHNRRHSFRARSNSPIRNYESPNWLLRRRRFSSSERGRQEGEIEQLNYRKPSSPTTRTSTNEGIENSRESRCEERRSRDTKSPTTATNMVCQQVQWNSGPAQGERANHLMDLSESWKELP